MRRWEIPTRCTINWSCDLNPWCPGEPCEADSGVCGLGNTRTFAGKHVRRFHVPWKQEERVITLEARVEGHYSSRNPSLLIASQAMKRRSDEQMNQPRINCFAYVPRRLSEVSCPDELRGRRFESIIPNTARIRMAVSPGVGGEGGWRGRGRGGMIFNKPHPLTWKRGY